MDTTCPISAAIRREATWLSSLRVAESSCESSRSRTFNWQSYTVARRNAVAQREALVAGAAKRQSGGSAKQRSRKAGDKSSSSSAPSREQQNSLESNQPELAEQPEQEAERAERAARWTPTAVARASSASSLAASASAAPVAAASVAAAPREEVWRACVTTSGGLAVAGLLGRQLSSWSHAAGVPISDCLQAMPLGLSLSSLPLTLAAAAVVSAARLALLRLLPAFAAATNASNVRALSNLNAHGSHLGLRPSRISEELLFRGALCRWWGECSGSDCIRRCLWHVARYWRSQPHLCFLGVVCGVAYMACWPWQQATLPVPCLHTHSPTLVSAGWWKWQQQQQQLQQ
ncbi:hypothetical protein CLOP_g15520 [Closterium sp. NIES-67]|nr:hypothetical protein CLOP_g15520 [Closterium sp. NIES-67]